MRGLLVVVLLCGVAHADPAADALAAMDRGIALFQAGDLQAAREAFQRARDLVPDKANPYRWLGLVDARLGRCKEAIEELDLFIKRVQVNDTRVIEAITVRDRCREELEPRVGTLVIESTPPGSEVRLDDPDKPSLGVTPLKLQVSVGSHLVFLRGPGFVQTVKSVNVGRNETVRLELTLEVKPAPSPSPTVAIPAPAPAPAPEHKKSKVWIIGVAVGGAAAAALAVGLGVGLSRGGTDYTVLPSVSGR